jgi:hypothetical protein
MKNRWASKCFRLIVNPPPGGFDEAARVDILKSGGEGLWGVDPIIDGVVCVRHFVDEESGEWDIGHGVEIGNLVLIPGVYPTRLQEKAALEKWAKNALENGYCSGYKIDQIEF